MKKFTKSILSTALVLFIIGVAVVLIAGISGGFKQLADKAREGISLAKIKGNDIYVEFLDGKFKLNGDFVFGNSSYSASEITQGGEENKYVVEGEINKIDVDIATGTVEIAKSDTDTVFITYSGFIGTADVSSKDGCLDFDGDIGDVVIYIPADYVFDEINIDLGTGDVNSCSISTETLEIDCGAGDINIESINAKTVDIDNAMGNVSFDVYGDLLDYSYDVEIGLGAAQIGDNTYSGVVDTKYNEDANKSVIISCGTGDVNIGFR